MTNLREQFEQWIADPPYEKCIDRFPDDPKNYCWPGNYRDITVQLAWDAWRESQNRILPFAQRVWEESDQDELRLAAEQIVKTIEK